MSLKTCVDPVSLWTTKLALTVLLSKIVVFELFCTRQIRGNRIARTRTGSSQSDVNRDAVVL